MNSNLVLVLAFAIGVIAGLRAMTAPMVASWAAHLHWINLQGSPLAFMGSIVTAAILTLAAAGEIVNDKLPKTSARTSPPQLGARIVMGGFAAATLSAGAGGSILVGAILGIIGALVGTFGGYQVRTRTVKAFGLPDFVIALVEDVIAVGGGFFLASRL
jgi:uncharacterized membrane protein